MRQSRVQILLFLVALAIQVLAPMVGNLAQANVFGEAGSATVLCQSVDGAATNKPEGNNHCSANRQCVLCQSIFGSFGFTLADSQPDLILTADWKIAAIQLASEASPTSNRSSDYRARAPPVSGVIG